MLLLVFIMSNCCSASMLSRPVSAAELQGSHGGPHRRAGAAVVEDGQWGGPAASAVCSLAVWAGLTPGWVCPHCLQQWAGRSQLQSPVHACLVLHLPDPGQCRRCDPWQDLPHSGSLRLAVPMTMGCGSSCRPAICCPAAHREALSCPPASASCSTVARPAAPHSPQAHGPLTVSCTPPPPPGLLLTLSAGPSLVPTAFPIFFCAAEADPKGPLKAPGHL